MLLLLHALWPTACFVHLMRDGRDVCLSVRHWPKGCIVNGSFATSKDDPISTAAVWWELHVRLGRQAGNELRPELYYEIRYESLVNHPAEQCAALCNFLRLPYDDAMLRFHEGRTKTDPALSAKRAWRPLTPGLRDWRTQMSAEEVERFEAAACELLDELGYPRVVPRQRPESLERASRIRNLLAQDSNWIQIQAVPRPQTESSERPSRIPDPWPDGSPRRSLGGGDGIEA
jgi:sulfotransferase family protein